MKRRIERIKLKQTCPKCTKTFEIELTNSEYKRNKYKKFCSRECANSKKWSEEHKQKLSVICKNSDKVKKANKVITEKKKKALDDGRNKWNNHEKKYIEFICLYCNKKGKDFKNNNNRKYHHKCWKKVSGGLREGSSRGKQGWYSGYWCDSSYELGFLIYCLEHNIKIERNYKGYKYSYKNKIHTYYPDFRVNGILTEIKNYRSELTNIKLNSIDENINVIYKDTIKPYLKYVIDKYGKDFIKLYEKMVY